MPGSAELKVDESAVDVHADALYMHLVADSEYAAVRGAGQDNSVLHLVIPQWKRRNAHHSLHRVGKQDVNSSGAHSGDNTVKLLTDVGLHVFRHVKILAISLAAYRGKLRIARLERRGLRKRSVLPAEFLVAQRIDVIRQNTMNRQVCVCLLYTSDAADEL